LFLLEDLVVYSASDLAVAADCEFGLLRRLDAKLGRLALAKQADAMLERTAWSALLSDPLSRPRAALGPDPR
jgi:hypothetical protein